MPAAAIRKLASPRFLLPLLLAAATTSCGSGGAPAVSGAVRTAINWPARSRAINALCSSLSLVVTFKGAAANGSDFAWTINRDGGAGAYSQEAATPGPVHYGSVQVLVNSFAQPDGQGAQTGSGAGTAQLKPGAGGAQLPDIQLATWITGIDVSTNVDVPPFTYVLLQTQLQNAASSLEGTGKGGPPGTTAFVVTPGSLFWRLISPTDGSVSLTPDGVILSNGTHGLATVVVTADGVSSPPSVIALETLPTS